MGAFSWTQARAAARPAFWAGAEGEYRLEPDGVLWFSPSGGHAWRRLEAEAAVPQEGWRHAAGCYCDLCLEARRGG